MKFCVKENDLINGLINVQLLAYHQYSVVQCLHCWYAY